MKAICFFSFIMALVVPTASFGQRKQVKSFNSGNLPVLVYKTKKDYSKNVPVILSPDGKSIVSFPAPGDVVGGNKKWAPQRLKSGYLLDHIGVGRNVAFLKYTYDEYAKMPSVPDEKNILEAVIDKNPLVVLYDCGARKDFKQDAGKVINGLIATKTISKKCKSIK